MINFNFTNINQKRIINITKECEFGPSPWEKHLAEKKRQKMLPMPLKYVNIFKDRNAAEA